MDRAFLIAFFLAWLSVFSAVAETNEAAPATIFSHPLSRAEAIDVALRQNSALLKGKADLRASFGIVIQLRSIALPQLSAEDPSTRTNPPN